MLSKTKSVTPHFFYISDITNSSSFNGTIFRKKSMLENTSARKQDGSYYKTSSMKSIRAAIDRSLRSPPHCKQFSIIGDPAFKEANQVLDAFVKDLRKTGTVAGVVHKKPITKQQIQHLYECGELGPANSTNPAQLQRTAWFYLVLYFGQRGRENQRQLKSNMLVFRKIHREKSTAS